MQHREHFRAQCLATGEGQQLAGELGGAVGGVEDGVQVTLLRSVGSGLRRISSAALRITVSRLLKSWATRR
jgi:hypothetical protein